MTQETDDYGADSDLAYFRLLEQLTLDRKIVWELDGKEEWGSDTVWYYQTYVDRIGLIRLGFAPNGSIINGINYSITGGVAFSDVFTGLKRAIEKSIDRDFDGPYLKENQILRELLESEDEYDELSAI
jgi:hypothetical protein